MAIAAEVLNRMLELGRPEYVRIAPCCIDPAGIQQNQALVEIDRF